MQTTITNILYWCAMAGMLLYFAYTKGWIFANFDSIDAKTAMMRLSKEKSVALLDVRTIQEYKEGHLAGATLIPLSQLPQNLNKLLPLKASPILVYCRSGNRSINASRILAKHGFTPLNIKGGIIALQKAGASLEH